MSTRCLVLLAASLTASLHLCDGLKVTTVEPELPAQTTGHSPRPHQDLSAAVNDISGTEKDELHPLKVRSSLEGAP
jgi:hypothetical protein